MIIETDRLIIREIVLEDVRDLFEYCSNPVINPYVTFPLHKSEEQTKGFINFVIEKNKKDKDFTYGLILKEENKLIGTIDLGNMNELHHTAEMAYAINPNYWNNGYATEAVRAIVNYGFEKKCLNRIFARCVLYNTGSEKVMQKIGMHFEGIQRQGMFIKGKYEDLNVYAILKEEWLNK